MNRTLDRNSAFPDLTPASETSRLSSLWTFAAQLFAVLVAGLVLFPDSAAAEEPCSPCVPEEAVEEPPPLWQTQLGLSYVATSGNTETTTFGVDLDARRRPVPWGVEFAASYLRDEDGDTLTSERTFASVRGTRTLHQRWDAFAGLSGESDEFAGFDLRVVASAGATFHALTGPRHVLHLDAGLTWTDVERIPSAGEDESYLGALLGGEYAWQVSETARFTQAATWFPNFDDSDDWRLESLTAVEASLGERLALRLGYELRFRNEPIPGREDTDGTTRASLVLGW